MTDSGILHITSTVTKKLHYKTGNAIKWHDHGHHGIGWVLLEGRGVKQLGMVFFPAAKA